MSKNRLPAFFSQDPIPSLSIEQCLDLLEQQPQPALVDVRRPDEYAEGAIPVAIHLELAEILDSRWQSLLPYKEVGIILQCRSGVRSLKAAQYLQAQGFERLWNMSGGYLAYLAYLSYLGHAE